MGWFGSLQLAYKYAIVLGSLIVLVFVAGSIKILYNRRRLQKHIRLAAELEASGAQEERVELNARELDEGDLFGVRAIQSGYYGGVAQSRPVSAAGSHSRDESSSTFLGSHPSPNLVATTPMSSVTSLPLDARHGSPGRQSLPLPTGVGRTATPPRTIPRPIKSALQPSEAELSGRINHDPAVNMSLEIPPSPLSSTGPPMPNRDSQTTSSAGSRSPSPSYPFASSSKDNHALVEPLHSDLPKERRVSARPVSTAGHRPQPVHSQSASIVSKSSDNDGPRSPDPEYTEFPMRPARTFRADRSLSRGSDHLPRTSSIPYRAPPSHADQPQDDLGEKGAMVTLKDDADHSEAPLPQPLRIGTAVDDWGNAIFQEIDQSIHDSKSMARPTSTQGYSHHTSKLSDSSSIYSSADAGRRYSSKKLSIDSKNLSQMPSTLPSSAPSESDEQRRLSPELAAGTRGGSDSSSHQAAWSHRGLKESGFRHPAEGGGSNDSYWRQHNQVPYTGRAVEMGHQHPGGFSASRGAGDLGKEGKRPGQINLQVQTINEVPSPLPSPMPGTAL
ncbi:hypothetical protein MMC29_006000 [Sticta canariensis]|nr:hypothetical protein [Sticta canariensis]